jgi:hypothetical protein
MFGKKFDLSNSVYNGLTVKNGRLINNRPDGVSGIRQAVDINKALKKSEKISMMAQAVRMGNNLSEMDEMMGGCSECD